MNLLGRHIFKTGVWNDEKFTHGDLDDMVDNFAKLKDIHHVPLKFGHNKDQDITDGQPAIGWIENVYRKGENLFADFAHVPKVVMDAIGSKKYRTVSVEVMKNAKLNGEKINTWFLDAVALLGADQPAVSGLEDLADLSVLSRASIEDGDAYVFSSNPNFPAGMFQSQNGVSDMDEKDLNAAIDKAMAPLKDSITKQDEKIDTLTTENKDLIGKNAELTKQVNDRKAEDAETKIASSRKSANEILDSAVRQKSIVPAQRDILVKTFGVKDDEKVQTIDMAELKIACGFKESKQDEKSATFQRSEEDEDLDNEPLDQQVVMATRKVQASKPDMNYAQAQQVALQANPKLAKAYADSNGTFNSDGGVDR